MAAPTLPLAPVWRRLAALLYDGFILLALSFCYGAAATLLETLTGLHKGDYQPMFASGWFSLGWVLTLVGFYYWFWRKSGQTIGMRTWRIKLTDGANIGAAPTRRQCLVRALIAPPLIALGGLAYWYSLFNHRRECLHDKISRTQVITVPKSA